MESFSKQDRKPKNDDASDWLDHWKLNIFNGEKWPKEDCTFIRPNTGCKILAINIEGNTHYIQSAPINQYGKYK